MMDARAPITLSVPVWITKSDPDDDYMKWLEAKLVGADWGPGRAREVKGCVGVSMRIASPVPPAGLSKRKQAVLVRRAGSFGGIRAFPPRRSRLF
jgi:hypothetical protein